MADTSGSTTDTSGHRIIRALRKQIRVVTEIYELLQNRYEWLQDYTSSSQSETSGHRDIRALTKQIRAVTGLYEHFANRYEQSQDYTSTSQQIRAVTGLYEHFTNRYEQSQDYTSTSQTDTSGHRIIRALRIQIRVVTELYERSPKYALPSPLLHNPIKNSSRPMMGAAVVLLL
ncbi:hypothetical protein [Sporosarcina cyprini]|uniref:hypothetical protein n=1 Tax=Sporosarcina cyprini TaxID=2910523 RepID=UPI001EDEC93E|nr:hypothetical protein [Sporosarcina cyprini]MCG3088214.1 hypothetical protein [Sporosarcina cyprini]